MKITCILGFHDWSKDCDECSRCGKTRENQHDWSKDCDKCSNCGKTRENQHDWSKDCEKCSKCGKIKENQHDWTHDCEKCSKCGKARENQHDWSKDCEKCSKCGKTNAAQHNWSKDCEKCSKCGKARDDKHDWTHDCEKCSKCKKILSNAHKWNGCKCTECGKIRDEEHNWIEDCETCSTCKKTRSGHHKWDGCKCEKCAKIRDEQHDWSKDCEKCSKCEKTRLGVHKWNGCKCSICGMIREEQHDWRVDCETCAKCGKTRRDGHNWDNCICSVCGQTRHNFDGCRCRNCNLVLHNWSRSKELNGCVRCGITQIEITTLKDLDNIRLNPDASYVLVNNIDASETKFWNDGLGFEPIAGKQESWCEFNGQGYAIRNLFINRPTQDNIGLFSDIGGTKEIKISVSNLILENVDIKGQNDVGSIFGIAYSCKSIGDFHCHNISVSGIVLGRDYVGGLIGHNYLSLKDCTFVGIVGGQRQVGGITGDHCKGNLIHMYVDCKVTGNSSIGGLAGSNSASISESMVICVVLGEKSQAGGLVGSNGSLIASEQSRIDKCFVSGSVSCNFLTGGLVAVNDNGQILNCLSKVEVKGIDAAGGLVGMMMADSSPEIGGIRTYNNVQYCNKISNCLTSGCVSGKKAIGSQIGMNATESGFNLFDCYWDILTTGQQNSCGHNTKKELELGGKTTEELMCKSTFINWDFDEIWQIEDGKGYPTLRCLEELNKISDRKFKTINSCDAGINQAIINKENSIKYFEQKRPDGNALCSWDPCPCEGPGTVIPKGQGYLYIPESAVEFRRDCLTDNEFQAKLQQMANNLLHGTNLIFTNVPVLICEKGIIELDIDPSIAQSDAKYWWNTGLIPLRPSPKKS